MPDTFGNYSYDTNAAITTTGSTNAYLLTTATPITAYHVGMPVLRFKANFSNTGSATLNVNSLGAVPLKKEGGATNLASGDIVSGGVYSAAYDGANFQVPELMKPANADTLDGFDTTASGNRWGVIAPVDANGVMEIGRYIDFHNSDGDTGDQDVRLETGGSTDSLQIEGSIIATVGVAREWTAQQNFDGATLTDAANISWDLNTQQVAQVTLGGNRTLDNPTNQKDGATYILEIIQDGTGSRTLTFDTAYQFPNGTTPTLSTEASAVDVMCCVSNGTKMRCNMAKNFQNPPSGAFLQQANQTGVASTFTFSDQNAGVAHAERVLICAICADTTPASISSATIGGVTATVDVSLQDTNEFAAIISAAVPTGTTATVVINFNTTATDCSIALYRFVGLNSQTPTATTSNADDVVSSTINVSANGLIVGCATFDADATAVTTAGVTENFDLDIGSSRAVGGFRQYSSAVVAQAVSFDGGATNAAGVWAAYR